MIHSSASATLMRTHIWLAVVTICLSSSARAQHAKASPPRSHTLKAGAMIVGQLDRALCQVRFEIGDTISATFGGPVRPGGSFNSPLTPRFTAVLRRVVRPEGRPGPDFVLAVAHARFGTARRGDLRALLRMDPESSDSSTGMPPSRCYSRGIVVGEVMRTLRY